MYNSIKLINRIEKMIYNLLNDSSQDLELHYKNQLDVIESKIERIKNIKVFEDLDHCLVYSWPECHVGITENVYEIPLLETLHIAYNFDEKSFVLGHGYDVGCFSSDHVEHVCKWLDEFSCLEDAIEKGNQIYVRMKQESDNIVNNKTLF